jgi:hypothetical protein
MQIGPSGSRYGYRYKGWGALLCVVLAGGQAHAEDSASSLQDRYARERAGSIEREWTLSDDAVLRFRSNVVHHRQSLQSFQGHGLANGQEPWDGSLGDSSAELNLFGGRIRLTTRHGWSRRALSGGADFTGMESDPSGWLAGSVLDPGWDPDRFAASKRDAGQSLSQTLEMKLLREGPVRLSAFGRLQHATETYRPSPRREKQKGLGLDDGARQRAMDLGARLELGPASFQFTEISEWRGLVEDREDSGVYHRRHKADVALSLYGLRERAKTALGAPAFFLTPDSLWLSVARGAARPALAPKTDATSDESIGLGWSWGSAYASLSAWRSFYDGRQPLAESADWAGEGADLGIGYYRDRWDVYGSVGVGRQQNLEQSSRSLDRSYDGSLVFSLRPKQLPDLTTAVSYSQYGTQYTVYESQNRSDSWTGLLTLDFSKYLPSALGDEPLKLQTTYRFSDWRYRDSSLEKVSLERDHALSLFLRLEF